MPKYGFTSSLLLISLAQMSLADELSAGIFDLSLEELLNTKITSSTLTAENLLTVPSSMTVFTRAEIKRLGFQTLNQLINFVPGFQSNRSDEAAQNYTISSRGRRLGTTSREVLVLIDGQRVNESWTGGFGQQDALIPIENVERIEIIRGPGSAIYGSNAMMGVINIITRNTRELNVGIAQYNGRRASVQWRKDWDGASLDVYAQTFQSDGEPLTIFEPFTNPVTPDYLQTHTPTEGDNIALRAVYGEFTLSVRHATRDSSEFYVAGFVENAENLYQTRSSNMALAWEHEFTNGMDLSGRINASEKKLLGNTASSLVPYVGITAHIRERELSTEWILRGTHKNNHWLMGTEWRAPDIIDTSYILSFANNSNQVSGLQGEEGRHYVRSVFGQYQSSLAFDLELITGLRIDDYSYVGSHVSPRLGLVHKLDDSNAIKMLYSEAFRAPSQIETTIINPSLVKNADLQPETAKTAELVWVHSSTKGVITATAFNTDITSAIKESLTPELKRTWINSSSSVNGVELEWQAQWQSAWQLRAAFTHLFHPVSEMHEESKNLLSGSLSYRYSNWNFSLFASYQGEKYDSNEQNLPADISSTEFTRFGGRTLVDTHVGWLVSNGVEIYADITNLTNKQYFAPASRPENCVGIPGQGRVTAIGLRWNY